jgi:penicillin-binding protein 1C
MKREAFESIRNWRRHAVVLGLIIGWLCIAAASYATSFQEVKNNYQASDAVLLDRNGEVIHELRVDPTGRRLNWTPLKDVSPALVKAVIHSEDKRFYHHHGVDWIAAGTVAVENLFSKKPRGASTITMQLASLLDDGLKPRSVRRTLARKWEQMQAARDLERTWSKDEILESYLNLVSFRGELQGITAASRGLFDKEPSGLDEAESTILAALIRSPNADVETTIDRAIVLAASMELFLKPGDIRTLAEKTLSRPYRVRARTALAPHIAHRLINVSFSNAPGTLKVRSTLDREIQRHASQVLMKQLATLTKKNVSDGAVLVVENRTGNVLAYVGNGGPYSTARYVDGIRARRQAGSTLKPFLYGLALEKRFLTAASLMSDAPLDVPTDKGIYQPENYDKEFRGFVTARTALASSLNVPAVRTLSLVGVDSFIKELNALGFTDLEEADFYGLSLALGSADISLWELVNGYRTLANDGVRSELQIAAARKKSAQHRVLSPEAAFIISDILSDREARSATFSLENVLATRYWTAVKTGTSKDMRDNWCVGYSSDYTVGVWVGNFSGAPMWDVSGITGAAPIWHEIMDYLQRTMPSTAPRAPRLLQRRVVAVSEQDSVVEKKEWFIAGTEPDRVERVGQQERILYPSPGTIIAVDPDIPQEEQRIFFESTAAGQRTWVLNNRVIGKADTVSWVPTIGKYALVLKDRDDRLIDEVEFEVR